MARVVTGNAITPVLACFVVLGTATAIYLLRQDPPPRAQNAEVEDVVEIDPALPRIALLPDSIPDDADDPADGGDSASLLDGFEWHDDRERRRRFEESLAKTIGEVRGLGVYIVPPPKGATKENR